jgi:S-adenosylmethionine-diacylglycerol 3-amino-3-carboxypropyl transferase
MSNTLSPWVAEAAALPVAFAQVREDPRIDRSVVERLGPAARVCTVASGGCTAALLATLPNVAAIHLVDPNPAQLALARLKLRMLENAEPDYRLRFFGHAPMRLVERWPRMIEEFAAAGLPGDAIGFTLEAGRGPDYAGRYERCFAALRRGLDTHREELEAVLSLADPAEQARRVAPDTDLGRRIDAVFDEVLSLPNLVALFGEGATRNPVEPFARHFARRLRVAFATLPAADNPFLWQMLRGRYPEGHPADWFLLPRHKPAAAVTWRRAFMVDALRETPGEFDLVHLSNILDWLSPAEATETLELAAAALRPGGRVVIRQLNSTLDIPGSGPVFEWDTGTAAALHARDRSFFYRALHLGRKR